MSEDNYLRPARTPSLHLLEGTGVDTRPLKETLCGSLPAILTASPGRLHRFESPAAVPPLSEWELQTRLATELRHSSCGDGDPPAITSHPVDPGLLNRYTGISDPEELMDDEAFDYLCLLSAGRGGMRDQGHGDFPDPATQRSDRGCNPYRSAGCGGSALPDDQCGDHHGITPDGADDQLDCDGVGDSGTIDNPISGGLWFDDMVTDPSY